MNTKQSNILIIKISEKEEIEREKSIFETIMDENFSNLGMKLISRSRKNRKFQMNLKQPTPRHSVFKVAKVKDTSKMTILKSTRRKQVSYKETR